MFSYKTISIIGTSHISSQSVKEVSSEIARVKPAIVAIELDRDRLFALLHGKKNSKISFRHIAELGVGGFLFGMIGAWAEKKLGKIVGVSPGSEMKAAIRAAAECNAKLALIDRDIRITIRHLFAYLTWREKFRFLGDMLMGLFGKKAKGMTFDLAKVPEKNLIERILMMTMKRYPSFYRALVSERDEIMAKNLYSLMESNKDKQIIAVVGAGHESGMLAAFEQIEAKWNTQKKK